MKTKMPKSAFGIALSALAAVAVALAQAPKEVPVAEEPRHHFAYENDVIRAFRVEVAPRDKTLLHRHERDYFYISLGPADIVNAVLGRPEVSVRMEQDQVGFAKGGFAHVAENRGDAPFRNFTIEFKRPQTKLSNRCAKVDPAQPLTCPKTEADGTLVIPEFETEDVIVALLRVKPGGKLALENPHLARLLMPIDAINAHVLSDAGKKTQFVAGKETWLAGGPALTVVNTGRSQARLFSIAIKENAKR